MDFTENQVSLREECMKLTENQMLLREGQKIVEALGGMLAPLVEVVLHDLTNPEHALLYFSYFNGAI